MRSPVLRTPSIITVALRGRPWMLIVPVPVGRAGGGFAAFFESAGFRRLRSRLLVGSAFAAALAESAAAAALSESAAAAESWLIGGATGGATATCGGGVFFM